jgi:hypothetical protein
MNRGSLAQVFFRFSLSLFLLLLGEARAKTLAPVSSEERLSYIRAAQVWRPTDIPHMDIWRGPKDTLAFGFEQRVSCAYIPKKPGGTTSKFFCRTDDGTKIKVRYDRANGKVYSMPAASRLFWALGFGAVRSFPVRVRCRDCPKDPWVGPHGPATGDRFFHPAVADLKMPGEAIVEIDNDESGWSWDELDFVDERQGGAPLAHRDALKLLAAFVQHGDNNPGQQGLICLPGGIQRDASGKTICTQPFLMIEDLGSTFGGAERLDERASMNLVAWASHHVWKDRERCVADLAHTPFGTLSDPQISEKGRAFLSKLLVQLSDQQIEEIFRVGRADRRDQNEHGFMLFPELIDRHWSVVYPISDWVRVFKAKREEIARAHCQN